MTKTETPTLAPDLNHLPFTPVQRRMMALFCDFQPHTREEIFACLSDDLSAPKAVHAHFSQIRKLLPQGYLLSGVTVPGRSARSYQLFRILQPVSHSS